MAKKITKKTVAKATKTSAPEKATSKVAKKTSAPKKVEAKVLTNITTIDDLTSLIKAKYEAINEEKIDKTEVTKFLNAYTSAFADFCANSEAEKATFVMPNTGTFTVKVVAEHEGINPRTMEKITVPAKKAVTFKAFPRFKSAINGEEE